VFSKNLRFIVPLRDAKAALKILYPLIERALLTLRAVELRMRVDRASRILSPYNGGVGVRRGLNHTNIYILP
jgi:hypothetical protein